MVKKLYNIIGIFCPKSDMLTQKRKGNLNLIKKKLIILPIAASLLLSGCNLFQETYKSAALSYDYSQMEFIQFEEPEEGQMTAVIHTTLGDITALLYPEYAPNTVDNFVNRAKDGYYDNNKFYMTHENYFAATGSNADDGSKGATNDGELIENEYTPKLWPFKGSLCAYSSTMGYSDSRFMMCNTFEFTDEEVESLRSITKDDKQLFPEELISAWKEHGALPTVSGIWTVFGQIIEGQEVLDRIMAADRDETGVPTEDIRIKNIEISEYKGGAAQ